MKRLLLILSLAFIAISCEEDQIIPAIEGPALTLSVAPAAYTDAEGTGADIQLTNVMEMGLYEFDQSVSIFTNSNRKFTTETGESYTGYSQSNDGWSTNGKTLYGYMPYSVAVSSVTSYAFELPTQFVQDVEAPLAHVAANNFMVCTAEVGSGSNPSSLQFVPQSCLLSYKFTNNTEGAFTISKLVFSNNAVTIPTKGVYNFRDSSLALEGSAANIQLTLSEPAVLEIGETFEASIPICAFTAPRNSTTTLEVTTDRGTVPIKKALKADFTYETGKYYAQNIDVTEKTYLIPAEVNLPEKQNSFIVTPSDKKGVETHLLIPVTRVNDFWASRNPDNVIDEDTPWVAEIIWKDFDFENKVLYMTEEGNYGFGTIDRISLTLNKVDSGQWGNALVGIKKADAQGNPIGDYLWSWHIWVSDVTTETAVSVNASQPGALLMDRHLGAKSANKADGVLTQGLLYQWGRKDPFIGTSAIAYAAGETPVAAQTNYTWPAPIAFEASFGKVSASAAPLEYAVTHPTTFITRSHVSWAWLNYTQASTSDFTYKLWMATADSGTAEKKTIYDPCPKGWRMPIQAAYGDGTANISNNVATNANMSGWVWDDTNKGYEVNGIWFPAQMGRTARTGGYGPDTEGSSNTADTETYADPTSIAFVVWTGQGSSYTFGGTARSMSRHLYFTKDVIQPQLRGAGRANANPVRCMRYTAEDE